MEHIHYEQLNLIDAIAIKKEINEHISELTAKYPNFNIKKLKENQTLKKELDLNIKKLENKLDKVQNIIDKHIYF